jgi:hypothetical protein
VTWTLTFRWSLVGWVLTTGRREHRRTQPVRELPAYVREHWRADGRGIIHDSRVQQVLDNQAGRASDMRLPRNMLLRMRREIPAVRGNTP